MLVETMGIQNNFIKPENQARMIAMEQIGVVILISPLAFNLVKYINDYKSCTTIK